PSDARFCLWPVQPVESRITTFLLVGNNTKEPQCSEHTIPRDNFPPYRLGRSLRYRWRRRPSDEAMFSRLLSDRGAKAELVSTCWRNFNRLKTLKMICRPEVVPSLVEGR